jgi:hypothetical protein
MNYHSLFFGAFQPLFALSQKHSIRAALLGGDHLAPFITGWGADGDDATPAIAPGDI